MTLLLCSTANAKLVFNYALGVLITLAFVKTTEIFVTQNYRAAHEPKLKRSWVNALMLVKWLALTAFLYFLNKVRYFDGASLLAGLITMHAVIILKVFGLILQNLTQGRPKRALK